MLNTSIIEISRSALRNNVRFLKKHVGSKVVFSSVIKGNAYGHGIEEFVPLAESCGVRHFSVYGADEAFRVLKSRTQASQIMIMGAIDDEELPWAVENGVSFYVFDRQRLEVARAASGKIGKPARIHLELETGLNRMGLEESELPAVVEYIQTHGHHFSVEGVCTHYAGAESVGNYLRIQNQIQTFSRLSEYLLKLGLTPTVRHTACSAAALHFPETILDMVRFGIAQYGY